jgi:glycosyltransferase involved in cell wall biosynthesis
MSKIRILLWCPVGSGLHYGGAGTNAYRLYNSGSQEALNFEVTLVCNNSEQADYPLFKNVHRLGRSYKNSWMRQWSFLRAAKRWLKENHAEFDVFHGIDIFESTVRPASWAQSLGLPAFVKPAIYGCGLAPTKGWRRLLGLPQRRRKLIRQLAGVVVISQAIEDELISYSVPPRLIQRIPNGVDTQLFYASPGVRTAVRKRCDWQEEDIILLFVGAICSRKQPDWIIRAAKELMQQHERLRLVFVGPEREAGYLDKLVLLAKNSGSEGRIHFIGHTEHVVEFYQAADLYCLPSVAEGMPNSVLEAMASGLPVIGTRISGTEELINAGENGYLIESPQELAERLEGYLKDSELIRRHGHASLLRIEAEFSSTHVLGRHLKMFRSAID